MTKIDHAKRRRIMQRSMKLGHCICDPKRPCPCDVFREQGICPCAGERPEPTPAGQVRLTEQVHNAGCASKIAPADLEAVLARLPDCTDPAVLCGTAAGDDAGVYLLPDGACLVQTVDVMTPVVDDPRTFGRICAANCLSDIYAMGGEPKTALSVLAFPAETLDGQIMYEMLDGAMAIFAEAGVAVIGGHSVKDEEIKLGFAITGTIDPTAVTRRDGLRASDALILTKPLGVGVLNFARQIGRDVPGLAAATEAMQQLNAEAARAAATVGVNGCTDVTGFGLFGHLVGMVRSAEVTAQVWADALPAFDGAAKLLSEDVIPGAIERNTEFVAGDLLVSPAVTAGEVLLGYDAQTSGGLLLAVPDERRDALLAELAARGVEAWHVGCVTGESAGQIVVTRRDESAGVAGLRSWVDAPHDAMAGQEPRHPNSNAPAQPGAAMPGQGATSSCCCAESQPADNTSGCCSADAGEESASCGGNEASGESCCGDSQSADGAAGCCDGGDSDDHAGCCSDIFGRADAADGQSTAPASMEAFGALMSSAGQAGLIDERTKELVNFALVLMGRCEPCFAAHWAKARSMGVTEAELDEVAWCAAAMGGAVVRMFYLEQKRKATTGGCC